MEWWALIAIGLALFWWARRSRRTPYQRYLDSPTWHALRRQALQRDGWRCRVCNGGRNLQVHHRRYRRWGTETVDDLTTLCGSCHAWWHNR